MAGGCIHTAPRPTDYNSSWAPTRSTTRTRPCSTSECRQPSPPRTKAPYRLLVDGKVRSVPSSSRSGSRLGLAGLHPAQGRPYSSKILRAAGARNWRRVLSPLLSAVPSQRFSRQMLFKRRLARSQEFPRTFTLQSGLSTLTERLASQERVSLRPGAAVTGLARAERGFIVAHAGGEAVRAGAVALALPSDAASRYFPAPSGGGGGAQPPRYVPRPSIRRAWSAPHDCPSRASPGWYPWRTTSSRP